MGARGEPKINHRQRNRMKDAVERKALPYGTPIMDNPTYYVFTPTAGPYHFHIKPANFNGVNGLGRPSRRGEQGTASGKGAAGKAIPPCNSIIRMYVHTIPLPGTNCQVVLPAFLPSAALLMFCLPLLLLLATSAVGSVLGSSSAISADPTVRWVYRDARSARGYCKYMLTGAGPCSVDDFKALMEKFLGELCDSIASGATVDIPSAGNEVP
ncbi:hypothetical protein VOLCADRAFT_87951 [Volvox carteri f. nagariensis]|uniref:Uncharacterized protein n=1 Tax=Volvox carteri f. nagariensis TaxID=3068 RepID=D8TMN9_VOLCA|nr:uncharacterized protein VOLCADRAFT_87951 [Volvox carteri f. nagariensis]EFJ51159.1 hypothetical protein VOLCADRAFT_87951 [Volvox carteri f. nagariensis]|eukprot:XP_002947626.1 hypothetical protein VOLCADRAFT_87951 [Volvox carteri f. nagariensis]